MTTDEILKRAKADIQEHGKILDWIKDVPDHQLVECMVFMSICDALGLDPVDYDTQRIKTGG